MIGRPMKSYTLDMIEAPKEGWDYWKRYLSSRLHYRVDLAGLTCLIGEEKVRKFDVKTHVFKPDGGKYLPYVEIFKLAQEAGVLPELVVDERYYYERTRMAPYRIAFAALRRGMTCWDLYLEVLKLGRLLQPYSLARFLLSSGRNGRRRMTIDTLVDLCLLVGLEPGDLFRPRAHVIQRVQWPVFAGLREALAIMDDVDVAALGGLAVALGRGDEKAIAEVLAWWKEVKSHGAGGCEAAGRADAAGRSEDDAAGGQEF